MSDETIVGIIGVAVAIFFGILGSKSINKWKQNRKQIQKVSNSSVAIQSGRDTKISKEND